MRIEQLRYLVEIADAGSFTLAAERLHIAQPSISQSISALEAELNVVLLIRKRSGASLTPAGQTVAEHARSILSEIRAIADISQTKQYGNRSVSVVAGVIPIATILPQAITVLKQKYPDISVTIQEGSTKSAEGLLDKHSIDFAIVPYVGCTVPKRYLFSPLFTMHLMAMVSKNSPLASKPHLLMQDIQPHPLAFGSGEYVSGSRIIESIERFGKANISLRTQNVPLIKKQVVQSNLIGLIYSVSSESDISEADDVICIPIKDSVDLTFGVLTRVKYSHTALSKSLIRELERVSAEYQAILDQKFL